MTAQEAFGLVRLAGRHALPLSLAETIVANAILVAAGLSFNDAAVTTLAGQSRAGRGDAGARGRMLAPQRHAPPRALDQNCHNGCCPGAGRGRAVRGFLAGRVLRLVAGPQPGRRAAGRHDVRRHPACQRRGRGSGRLGRCLWRTAGRCVAGRGDGRFVAKRVVPKRPNQLWVADLTYVAIPGGFVVWPPSWTPGRARWWATQSAARWTLASPSPH